ncbi:23S rRNA (pseudouridine(1915)-N(3))-methyltransferase RlmH [Niabella yanshanensis]|uniref:Ribosomal RNA large subunit methyltransferase H n=1 Tax=Niabella yanshanensis TaxID=577386 RepID=A0ABZ0WBQ6_9BACT|nr:23S rRNA (pseudouridine(1915)-N(3))-methyltransferase RlmH [Niabella yanshanensis]WQD39536.1 23S rRNA (pseudouridine(1915)-N(3))-methyltransferase RlmH [Niabella yanshanensis]
MKIFFWSIGKNHDTYVKSGIEDFSKRINNYFKLDWEIIAPLKNAAKMSIDDIKKNEGELILSKVQKEDFLVALDERGTQLSSEGLAQQIQLCANNSSKRVIFLIGGAFGIHDAVLNRANFKWSLSKLVFPHQLVRLILAEQVYRACTILKNEKYHHQ